MFFYGNRRLLRGESRYTKIQHAHDRLGESEMEHIDAVPHLRSQQGRVKRVPIRSASVHAQCVRGQDRTESDANLPRTMQREQREHAYHTRV